MEYPVVLMSLFYFNVKVQFNFASNGNNEKKFKTASSTPCSHHIVSTYLYLEDHAYFIIMTSSVLNAAKIYKLFITYKM